MSEKTPHTDLNADAASEAGEEPDANGADANGTVPAPVDHQMAELRQLLIGNEGKQIAGLQERINGIAKFEEDGQIEALGRELPNAIAYHNDDRSKLANVLGPTIEETLSLSIRRNPQPFADAIFPAIGPAIRRSITEALRSVIESMNRTMEQSLSVRSVKWRMEAARTGRSFSEVMLAHTLNYRVEQLFLIDKKSGLLIQHLFAETVEVKDSDIVSSMLNAIQDFVRDSLGAEREDVLESIEIGDLTVMIEPGPDAILAAVVRGIPTSELRTTLKEIIEAIHLQYGHILDDFDGDTDPLTPVLPLMRAGLLENYKSKERSRTRMWIIAGLILMGLGIWFVWSFRNYMIWQDYLDDLRNEPGIVVTQTSWEAGQFVVEGLRDPMAADPSTLLPDALPAERVEGIWESYVALDSLIVVKRTARQLRAPASVQFSLDDDILYATGTASRSWMEDARQKAAFSLGFSTYDDSGLSETSAVVIGEIIADIERTSIEFGQGSSVLAGDQRVELDSLAAVLGRLSVLNSTEGYRYEVLIHGYASTEGTEAANRVLSAARANSVRDALIDRGLPSGMISTIGTGDPLLPGVETSEAERAANRSVTFDVIQR